MVFIFLVAFGLNQFCGLAILDQSSVLNLKKNNTSSQLGSALKNSKRSYETLSEAQEEFETTNSKPFDFYIYFFERLNLIVKSKLFFEVNFFSANYLLFYISKLINGPPFL